MTEKRLIMRILLLTAGAISLLLGVVGLILPILPTTPFLLLAAYCFLRSSRQTYVWLINHRFFGQYIVNYIKYRAVKRWTKITSLTLLWCSLLVSALFLRNVYLALILLCVGITVSIHIFKLRTLENVIQQEEDKQ